MTAIDFPNAPTVGQSFTSAGVTWTWDGTRWTSVVATDTGLYLPLAGGTLTGPLILAADPTANLHAATRQYVDGAVTRAGGPFLPIAGGILAGALAIYQNAATVTSLPNTLLWLAPADGIATRLLIDAFGQSPQISMRRAQGTAGAPTALLAGSQLGLTNFYGHDGVAYSNSAASFNVVAGGDWSPTSRPTAFIWNNTPVGSAAIVAGRMTLSAGGNLLIGIPIDSGYRVDAVGATSRFDAGLGGAFPVATGGPNPNGIHIASADGAQTTLTMWGFGTTAGHRLQFVRANGTRAAPTALLSNTNMASIQATGFRGTTFGTGAVIQFTASENWSETAQGTTINFLTTPLGSTTIAEAMRVQPSGCVSIGTITDSTYKLDVNGAARFGTVGFNLNAPIAKPAITGSRAGNAALASVLTQLAAYGLITDSTTA